MKQFFLVAFCMLCLSINGQSVMNGQENRKFYLSLSEGWNFALGSSSTVITKNVTLPASKNGYSPSFDGAYFFSKNYGIGIKYGFYTSNYKKESTQLYTDHPYDYLVNEYKKLAFKERTHLLGPALYSRWFLEDSRWMIIANAGVVALHNKMSGIEKETQYNYFYTSEIGLIDPGQFPDEKIRVVDHTGITAGFTLSAGIRFQVLPFAGINLQTNGLYASLSKMKYYNQWEKRDETGEISRRISRIGLSAAVDFSF